MEVSHTYVCVSVCIYFIYLHICVRVYTYTFKMSNIIVNHIVCELNLNKNNALEMNFNMENTQILLNKKKKVSKSIQCICKVYGCVCICKEKKMPECIDYNEY